MNLDERVFYIGEKNRALEVVAGVLTQRGIAVTDTPSKSVTHLLLGAPCRSDAPELKALLKKLPRNVQILGGFLDRTELKGYDRADLLLDPEYLAQNAAITAHCALQVVMEALPVTLDQCQVLILGWGRIGKCLAQLLKALGAQVVVAARNPEHRAMIRALGFEAEALPLTQCILSRFRVVLNTVPSPLLSAEALAGCHHHCVKIELASRPGLEGEGIIDAKGLPGRLAPESAGKLIARTVLRLSAQKEEGL